MVIVGYFLMDYRTFDLIPVAFSPFLLILSPIMSPSYDLPEHFKQEITHPRRPRLESKQSSRARFRLKRVGSSIYSIVLWL